MPLLTNWDPFAELTRFQEEMMNRRMAPAGKLTFRPAVDIFEDPESITITAEVPGVKAEDLQVHVEDNVLTLKGERKLEKEEKKEGYHRIERSYGAFTRSFSLPEGVDGENVHAERKDGVLQIKLMKKAKPTPKKIEIKGEV
jgi:HSP20 family protein